MGVDLNTKNQISRWALKSDTLESDAAILKKYNPDMGAIKKGSRNAADGSLLQWELIMPLAAPEVEIAPFVLDWSATEKHPSALLPDMGCELISVYGTHPNPELFQSLFKSLGYVFDIRSSKEIKIKAIIEGPNGRIEL